MTTYLFDILIVVILVFFAWRGAKKGLILTLCSLVGIFIAFFGARFVSAQFYEPVAHIIEPPIYQSILGVTKEDQNEAAFALSNSKEGDPISLEDLLDKLKESELFIGFSQFLEDAVEDNTITDEGNTAAKALSGHLSLLVAKAGLFAVTFLLILLIWFLLGHALDLAFKLPGLSAINWIGGLILGLLKAVLLCIVLVWMFQLVGWVANPPETPVVSFFTVQKALALLNSLVA